MTNDNVASAVESINRKYKSLDSPDFTFVRKCISHQPYELVVRELKKIFAVEEITDTNDDVSFRYLLTRNSCKWVIELSMVGQYSNVFRLSELNPSKLITDRNSSPEDKEILVLLSKAGFIMLSEVELETPIALKLFNTDPGRVKIYQALFSDIDLLPWQGQSNSPWTRFPQD